MRAHVIENGKITNTIEVDSLDFPGLHLADAELGGQIGDGFVDGAVVPAVVAPPAPVVPQEVSRRRGLQALFKMYRLTEADVEAHITDAITNEDERYLALTEFRTSQTFERNRALVVMMGHLLDLDLDALFIMAAALP